MVATRMMATCMVATLIVVTLIVATRIVAAPHRMVPLVTVSQGGGTVADRPRMRRRRFQREFDNPSGKMAAT